MRFEVAPLPLDVVVCFFLWTGIVPSLWEFVWNVSRNGICLYYYLVYPSLGRLYFTHNSGWHPWVPLDLLWRHVGQRANRLLRTERTAAVRERRQPKVTEQYLLSPSKQHILRLHITMDEFLLMGILQSIGHLPDMGDDLGERHHRALGIAAAQGAIGGIVHHQKRHPVLHIIIQDAHNRGMHQLRNRLGFLGEVRRLLVGQVGVQHLDRRLQRESHMLPEIHLGKAALSQRSDQPVVTKLLANSICHRSLHPVACPAPDFPSPRAWCTSLGPPQQKSPSVEQSVDTRLKTPPASLDDHNLGRRRTVSTRSSCESAILSTSALRHLIPKKRRELYWLLGTSVLKKLS